MRTFTTNQNVFKKAENDGTRLSALGKEATAGDDVVFKDIATEFPCIYNRGSAQFKYRNLNMNAWRKIGKLIMAIDNVEMENKGKLQSHKTASKQCYDNIRTLVSCYLKRIKPPSGSDQVSIDERYEHLRWLITFIKTRSITRTSMALHRRSSNTASATE